MYIDINFADDLDLSRGQTQSSVSEIFIDYYMAVVVGRAYCYVIQKLLLDPVIFFKLFLLLC